MFYISEKPIDIETLKHKLQTTQAGAFCSFEGWVRDHHDGQDVTAITYESYPAMCQQIARDIFNETNGKFDVLCAVAVHRTGRLKVGDLAVWVGVSAPHRDDAFKACRYIIDEIKQRLPIWKKEHYVNGSTQWINCSQTQSPMPVS